MHRRPARQQPCAPGGGSLGAGVNLFPTDAGWRAWPAPAKLNLFLRIIGRRADGYHHLQTVFRLLDWGDTVYLRPRSDGVIARIGAGAAGVAAPDDLMVRAAKLLQQAANCSQGAGIGIEKRIPMGGGFGGGSSDAATVLVVLNRLWGLHWEASQLAALGLRLGADVPVFIHGHTVGRRARRHHRCESTDAALDGAGFIAALDGKKLASTT